jgi:hypothetical protein
MRGSFFIMIIKRKLFMLTWSFFLLLSSHGKLLIMYNCCVNSGFAIQLDPIEQEMMESGSWHWDYKIEGSHIKLELAES